MFGKELGEVGFMNKQNVRVDHPGDFCPDCGEMMHMVWEKWSKGCTRVQRCLSCRTKERKNEIADSTFHRGWTAAVEEIVAWLEQRARNEGRISGSTHSYYADKIAAKFLIWGL